VKKAGMSLLATLIVLMAGCTAPQATEPQLQAGEQQPQASVQPARVQEGSTPSPLGARPETRTTRPKKVILDVPIISQNPQLKYGCEVTSLAMLLRHAGHDVDKVSLAQQVKKDPEPLVQKNGDIKEWGDPNKGFVGDMTGVRKGFAVYNKPLEELLRRYVGERSVNLTGGSYQALLDRVAAGRPVVIWTTGDFQLPTEWESWHKDGKKVVAPFDEHAVLLVGYDERYAYVNDPLTGVKQQRVSHAAMKKSWEALGKQAISYQ
jgi:uncharacterized protein YvpB